MAEEEGSQSQRLKALKTKEFERIRTNSLRCEGERPRQEVIFTENTASLEPLLLNSYSRPDREIWDEKGGLIKKGPTKHTVGLSMCLRCC